MTACTPANVQAGIPNTPEEGWPRVAPDMWGKFMWQHVWSYIRFGWINFKPGFADQ